MNDIRTKSLKVPNLKEAWIKSVEPLKNLCHFNRMPPGSARFKNRVFVSNMNSATVELAIGIRWQFDI
jgi:hypothetical protein